MAYIKYHIYKKQVSYDNGTTWNDLYPTEIVPSGSPIGTYDTLEECEGAEMYRWVKTNDTSCKIVSVTSVTLNKNSLSLASGSTEALKAIVSPSNAEFNA